MGTVVQLVPPGGAVTDDVPQHEKKPQLTDGYTRIVNEVMEGFAACRLSSLELRMCFAIARKTYGYNKGKDRIAASQLAELMGITRQRASSTLAGLIAKKVVIREGGCQAPIKINTKTDQWIMPEKGTQPPKPNRNGSPDNENGSVNRNTVRNTNPKTVHTKDKRQKYKNTSYSSSERPARTPTKSPEKSPARKQRPDAAIQSPCGRKWGYEIDLELAKAMANLIDQRLGQDAPANRNMLTWANEIRLMREQDGRPSRAIGALFAWAQEHHFWRSNILSPSKLRKQWATLAMQRNEQRKAGDGHGKGTQGNQRGSGSDGLDKQLTDFEYARKNF